MSTSSTVRVPGLMDSLSAARARAALSVRGLSATGVLLFITSILVVASGYTSLRPDVMGLALHPYLVPVALAVPFVLMARIAEFPIRVLAALLVFMFMYCFSVVNGASVAVGEIFKTGSAVVTIVTCALLVRKRGDFVAGALGLSIAIALLAARGLQEETKMGVEAMQGANKNSYSLFALPAILLAGFICLRMGTVRVAVKSIFVVCTLPALAAIFMSGNRSGYLGAALVGFMLFWDRRGRGMVLVGAIALAVGMWLVQFGHTSVLDQRIKQTMEGNKSDEHRLAILQACLEVGFENPIIGISPQLLPFELGRRTSVVHHLNVIEAHNIFAHVFAASGMICFAGLLAVGFTMWTVKPRDGGKLAADDPLRDARRLMRMMVLLWVVRGMFTREILYNPSFNIALGLAIGLAMLAQVERRGISAAAKSQSAAGPPQPLPRPAS
ncbi:MAG TPA: O-antigen ligase family protein [Pirellulales bacterium]